MAIEKVLVPFQEYDPHKGDKNVTTKIFKKAATSETRRSPLSIIMANGSDLTKRTSIKHRIVRGAMQAIHISNTPNITASTTARLVRRSTPEKLSKLHPKKTSPVEVSKDMFVASKERLSWQPNLARKGKRPVQTIKTKSGVITEIKPI